MPSLPCKVLNKHDDDDDNSGLARRSRSKLWVAVTNWMDHLLKVFQKHQTEYCWAVDVFVTSLHAISDPKVAFVCESIKDKLLNGNAYKTQVRRKMTSSARWLSRIFEILWFWPQKFQNNLFCFWMKKNDHKTQILNIFKKTYHMLTRALLGLVRPLPSAVGGGGA